MKWTKNYPKDGDKRVIRRFLFFPREIDSEVRWLCFAKIKQRYKIIWWASYYKWEDQSWID